MDDAKLGEVADQLHMFLPFFYRKVMAWHKCSEGLNPGHYMILGTLMHSGSLSMSDLGKRICSSKPGTTFLTDRLISEGMLERKYDEKDRRIVYVSLTRAGKDFMKRHREEEKEEIKKNLAKLNDVDIEGLCDSFERIKEIITKLEGAERDGKE